MSTSPEVAFANGLEQLDKDNLSEAIRWFKVAALADHAKAKNMVGAVLAQQQDLEAAYPWFCKAAANGIPEAQQNKESVERMRQHPGGFVPIMFSR